MIYSNIHRRLLLLQKQDLLNLWDLIITNRGQDSDLKNNTIRHQGH